MAIMLLAEQEKLSYEERLPAYFPQLPSWSSGTTIRHLLHHTPGLPGYMEFFSSEARIPEWTRDVTGVTNDTVLERTADLARLEPSMTLISW
jgi:CubicO group peptidase (beta-lactamase class C family)